MSASHIRTRKPSSFSNTRRSAATKSWAFCWRFFSAFSASIIFICAAQAWGFSIAASSGRHSGVLGFIECFFMPGRVREYNAIQAAAIAASLGIAVPGWGQPEI